PLQHPIHLCEIEITEQRRDDTALRNASFSVGLEHDLQQVHHVCIVHALCYFHRSSKVIGKVANIWIDAHRRHTAPCLALEDRGLTLPRATFSDPWARVLRRPWPLDTRRFGRRALVQETAALDPGKRIVASSRRCKTLIVVILVSWRSVACRPQRRIWRIP